MKAVSRITLVIMLLFAVVPVNAMSAAPGDGAPSQYSDNLLVNGNFDLELADWGTWPPEDTYEVMDLPSHSRNSVLKMQTEGIPAQWGVSEAHQWVNVEANQPFSLSADLFFESAENALVTMRIDFYDEPVPSLDAYISHDSKDIYYNFENPSDVFETVSIAGIAPKGTQSSKVEFDIKAIQANAKGTAYIDNASLHYQWAPTNLRQTSQTDTSLSFEWDAPRYGEGYQYEVYDDKNELIGEPGTNTAFTVGGLKPNTAYSFYVVAKMDTLASYPSNTLRAATNNSDDGITIMPLGDSITKGVYNGTDIPGGYRGYLWNLLQSKYLNVDFVGSLKTNSADIEGFDPDHEGYPLYDTAKIAALVDSQVAVYKPDYVLLHAGTNDMWIINNNAAENMKKMLEDITEKLPGTYVIVASIPGIYEDNPEQPEDAGLLDRIRSYNAALKVIVQDLRSAGKKVGFVDMGAMVTEEYINTLGGDDIHPNADGYKVMADVWYDALDAVITTGDVAGMIPIAPALNVPVLNEDKTSVQLSWQAAIDNVGVDRYEIYQDNRLLSVTDATYADVTGLSSGTTYSFAVEAVDKAGNRSLSNVVTKEIPAIPDRIPPTAPTAITALEVKHDSIKLSWLPGTDDVGVSGYEVNYSGKSTTVTSAVYGDFELTGLSPETEYTVSIKTIDHAENKSVSSIPLTIETKALPVSNLSVKSKSSTSITLEWDAATDKDGVAEYRIYVNDMPPEETTELTYTINRLVPGQTYTFKVTAVDKQNKETNPTLSSQTMVLLPPVGLALKGEPTTTAIPIRWSSVDGATGYEVYADGELKTTTSGTEYQIEGLKHNTEYTISLKSKFGEGLKSVMSKALEVRTERMPDPQVPPPQGSPGGFTFPMSPAHLQEYSETDKGIQLRFVPNNDESKKSLNGADERLVLNIPATKPFDRLNLELSGDVLKLAADKKKPIEIRMGSLTLELPAGWLDVKDKDVVILSIDTRSLEKDEAAGKQSLKPISSAYDFEVQLNGAKLTAFSQPVKLSILTQDKLDEDQSGVYLKDEASGTWTYQGGLIEKGSKVMLELPHFSEYAVFTGTKTFSDISSHWARKDIEALAAKQIVFGLTNDEFGPSGEVKRAEFAVMLARAFKLEAVEGKLPFEDVSELAWYHDGIKAAYQAGWIQGVSETQFAPNARITREQMAVMIMKAYLYANTNSTAKEDQTGEPSFKDMADISEWSAAYVRQAYKLELVSGMDGSFNPKLYADRSQAAAMINRLLKLND